MLNESQVPEPVEGLDEYLKQNDLWVHDVKAAESRSAKVIRYVALGLLSVAVCEGLAIAAMMPLKTVVPYMIVEDNHTGFWRVEKPLSKETITRNEARDKFLIRQYINYREGYSKDFYEDSYVALGYLSSQSEQARIAAIFALDNERSPINIYSDKSHVKIFVKNISMLNKSVAQVRFSKLVYANNDIKPEAQNWVATLSYKYADAEMSEEALTINPFGFQVTEYRLDPEAAERR